MIDWLIDSLIDSVIDWLIRLIVEWLIDWLIRLIVEWLIDWLIRLIVEWLIDWLIDWLDWLIGLIKWVNDWVIDCVTGKAVDDMARYAAACKLSDSTDGRQMQTRTATDTALENKGRLWSAAREPVGVLQRCRRRWWRWTIQWQCCRCCRWCVETVCRQSLVTTSRRSSDLLAVSARLSVVEMTQRPRLCPVSKCVTVDSYWSIRQNTFI